MHNKGIIIRKPRYQNFLNKNFYLYGSIKADYDTGWAIELSRDAEIIFDVGCNIGINAILSADIDGVRAVGLIGSLLFVLSNLLTDICYALVDPRVKLR